MNYPANSHKVFFAAGALALLLAVFSTTASADTTPKFVYVANAGPSSTSDTIETYSITATAVCGGYCASPISISGSFTVDSSTRMVINGTMYMTDTSDLKASPVALPFNLQGYFAPGFLEHYLLFQRSGGTGAKSSVELIFPFRNYFEGPMCTAGSSGCDVFSGASIGGADMSATLFSETTACCANGVSGSITSATVTLTGTSDVSQEIGGNVTGYSIDPTTGVLSPIAGSPFTAGTNPSAIAVDPSNKFVYVANQLSNNVSAFTVDASTGALTQITGSPFAAGMAPVAIAVDPLGKYVYVVNQNSSNVSVFTFDSQTGALTPASGSPIVTGSHPDSVAVDPLGKFVYVTNFVAYAVGPYFSDVSGYTIDRTTNTFNPVPGSPINATGVQDAAVDPSGKFLYISIAGDAQWGFQGYGIDGITGALTYIPTDSYASTGAPGALAFDPAGKFFYLLDQRTPVDYYQIDGFNFNNLTGALSQVPASPFTTNSVPQAISIDPSGKFAYVAGLQSKEVSAFTIDGTTGNLVPVAGSPFATGASPMGIAIVSSSSAPFAKFEAAADIDEDRKTSFRVAGFFTLADVSDGIDPLTQAVLLQVGSFTATIPAGSFREAGKHAFKFDGTINGTDLKITINAIETKISTGQHDHPKREDSGDYLFTAEGKGAILAGVVNPVTVGLTIGDEGGSASVKAIIEK